MKHINSGYKGNHKSIFIVNLGDIHLGNKYTQLRYAEDALKFVDKNRNRCRINLMGDLFEVATKTSVGRGVYDEAYPTQKQYTKGAEIFKPYSDIIDCIVEGNHEERIIRDTSFEIMEEFADKIRCPEAYAKFDAIVNYRLGEFTYSAYCWHGATGGTTEAAAINAMLKMREQAICHMYFMGHTHKLLHVDRKIYMPNPGSDSPKELEQLFVNTGTCLAEGGYGVQKGFPMPVCGFGAVEIFADTRKMVFHKIKDLL